MHSSISPIKLNHFNLVMPDFHASLKYFGKLYDAEFLLDIPGECQHAGLFDIGRVIFEIFSPKEWLMSARYGAHFVGVEYQADMKAVREAVKSHGIRIVRDVGLALHTHPEDTFGVAFEFYDGEFHERNYERLGNKPMRSAEYWQDAQELGLQGLKHYSLVVENMDKALRFLQSFLSASIVYEEPRPEIGAKALGVKIADGILELLTPLGAGMIQQHHYRYGDGIRSCVFAVGDLDQVKAYFKKRNIRLDTGDSANSLAITESDNCGIRFEFSE